MSLILDKRTIDYYIERLKGTQYFAFCGYSDAEWLCVLGVRIGHRTGFGQLLTEEAGKPLTDILRRRHTDPNFMFAIPEVAMEQNYIREYTLRQQIEYFLRDHSISRLRAYERDMVLDDLAANAGLYPLIAELRNHRVVFIGNKQLHEVQRYLNIVDFIGVDSPDLHTDMTAIENAVTAASKNGDDCVYLVSAGISSAILIDKLYDQCKRSFLIDCGSIWDCFAGIGGQRTWRQKLYQDPQAWERWVRKNAYNEES